MTGSIAITRWVLLGRFVGLLASDGAGREARAVLLFAQTQQVCYQR